MQVDYANGSYTLYKTVGGVTTLVAQQENMVNPGKVDFGGSVATTLSIGESYSKLIWHAAVAGNCETTAPFTGTCSSSITGCGYDNLSGINGVTNHEWDGAGQTRSPLASSPFNTHIPCDATWGGPMATPPVFKRRIDDVIVLTKAGASQIGAATSTSAAGTCGTNYFATFPGFGKLQLGDGMNPFACPAPVSSGKGIIGYWDLKNDPSATYNQGPGDTGMAERQIGLNNNGGGLRYNEIKQGPMATTILEANNVRVKWQQTGKVYPYGLGTNTQDCCITWTQIYVTSREGVAGDATGSLRMATTSSIVYDGTDGLGPLTTIGTSTGNNWYIKAAWDKISGEVNNQTNFTGACAGSSGLTPFTGSPWGIQFQGPGTGTNKDFILFAPVAQNSSNVGEKLTPNNCTSPSGANPGPNFGQVYLCNGATSAGCSSQTLSGATVKSNFLNIERESQGSISNIGDQTYFGGGLRLYMAAPGFNLAANVPVVMKSMFHIGDNGITSPAAATPYVTEYKTPPTMTITGGTGGVYDSTEDYWLVTMTGSSLTLSANGTLHNPIFDIGGYSAAPPATMTIGGVVRAINAYYVADKQDSLHLLIQPLGTFTSGTTFTLSGSVGPVSSPAKGKFKCKGCKIR
jgi:hypothetical protein